MTLTPRQLEVHDFLTRFQQKHGYAPTIAEIQKHFQLNSPATVHEQLAVLERRGLIRRQKHVQRGIEILQSAAPAGEYEIPLLGVIGFDYAYGFNRDDAKTPDHFFTGFPSYWNIVVFYLFVARFSPEVNAAILLALAVMVFVPIRYLYPSRGAAYQRLTNVLGVIWGALMIAMLWQFPAVSRPLFLASLVFPAYYVILSFVLDARRRRGALAG